MQINLAKHFHHALAEKIKGIFSNQAYQAEVDKGIWHQLIRLKQDYLNANNDDENEELLLFLHAMLWLKQQARYQNYKIVIKFFNFFTQTNLSEIISEDEEEILASITSIVAPFQTSDQDKHWHTEKSKLLITFYRALINNTIAKLGANNGARQLETAASDLTNLSISLSKRKITKPVDEEDYKALLGAIHFNLACIYMQQDNLASAIQAYNRAKQQGNERQKELAQQRLESFKQMPNPITQAIKDSHTFYRFGYPMPELKLLDEPAAVPAMPHSNQVAPVAKRSAWIISLGIIFALPLLTLTAAVLLAHFGIAIPVLTAVGAFLISAMPSLLVPLIASISGVLALSALAIAITEILSPGLVFKRLRKNSSGANASNNSVSENQSSTQSSSYQQLPEDMQQPTTSPSANGSEPNKHTDTSFSPLFVSTEDSNLVSDKEYNELKV